MNKKPTSFLEMKFNLKMNINLSHFIKWLFILSIMTYITGYGLRPFQIKETIQLSPDSPKQFKGRYKLPKNITVVNGRKWVDLVYYFTKEEVK